MAICNKKYFWKKKTHFSFRKLRRKNLKLFDEGILAMSIPGGFLKVIDKRNKKDFRKKTKYFLLALGNTVVYKKEKLEISIKNIKFKIKKTQNIFYKNINNVIQNHKILIDIGSCVQFLELSML